MSPHPFLDGPYRLRPRPQPGLRRLGVSALFAVTLLSAGAVTAALLAGLF